MSQRFPVLDINSCPLLKRELYPTRYLPDPPNMLSFFELRPAAWNLPCLYSSFISSKLARFAGEQSEKSSGSITLLALDSFFKSFDLHKMTVFL